MRSVLNTHVTKESKQIHLIKFIVLRVILKFAL